MIHETSPAQVHRCRCRCRKRNRRSTYQSTTRPPAGCGNEERGQEEQNEVMMMMMRRIEDISEVLCQSCEECEWTYYYC